MVVLIGCSEEDILQLMWPEGAQNITETTKRPITAGTNFKNSIIALVDNLATKVGTLWCSKATQPHKQAKNTNSKATVQILVSQNHSLVKQL